MTAHPLANHLIQQHQRTARMLAPGARLASARSMRPLASLLSGFGGLKFQLAARKMRVLDPVRLGSLQPQRFLRPLLAPIEKTENLLHLLPPADGTSMTWGPIETIFPNPFPESEPAPQAGAYRQGSIIPPMPSFPQPGQTLESFKQQVQDRPRTPPPPVEAPRPRPAPNARPRSRVQEFPTEKPAQEAPVRSSVEPSGPGLVQRHPEQPPGPVPELPAKIEPAKVEIPPAEPLKEAPSLVISESAKKEARPSPLPPPPAPEPPKIPLARPVRAPGSAPVKPLAPSSAPLPKASPRASSKSPASALPVAKTAPAPRKQAPSPAGPNQPQKATQAPPPVTAEPSQPSVVSRKPTDLPAPALQPPSQLPTPQAPSLRAPQPERPAAMPVPEASLPPQGPPSPNVPPSTPESPTAMPIRKSVSYRRQAPARLKSIHPEAVKPQSSPPLPVGQQNPLISPRKYHRASPQPVTPRPEEPVALPPRPSLPGPGNENARPAALTPEPPASSQPQGAELPSPASTSPVSMDLAYPPRLPDQPPVERATPTSPAQAQSARKEPEHTRLPSAPRTAGLANIVQRSKWPENEGDSGATPSSGGSAAAESNGTAPAPAPDLSQLAESVFPYLKRLLEIERDRVSGHFR